MQPKTPHEINQEAAEWAAKVDRGLSTDEQSALDAWLAGNSRRVGAYARMRAIALQTERVAALGPVHDPAVETESRPSRRKFLFTGGAIAASVIGMGALGWVLHDRVGYHTQKGEMRRIVLDDGSIVTLNTSSRVDVRLSDNRREIWLANGEALFDVASDKARPFVVYAGDTQIRAIGTSFAVSTQASKAAEVLVGEGIVEVTRMGGRPLRLKANMHALSAPAASGESIAVREMPASKLEQSLAWRDGRIAFEGETLQEAVIEFLRYSDTRIIVEDPALASERIAGLYSNNDPVGFAKAVALSLHAQVEVSNSVVRIRRDL